MYVCDATGYTNNFVDSIPRSVNKYSKTNFPSLHTASDIKTAYNPFYILIMLSSYASTGDSLSGNRQTLISNYE